MSNCRCCGADSSQSIEYLNLGDQPLANSYHKGEVLPRYPLRVRLCTVCYLSYLSETINPDDMFRTYLYVSGTTNTFREHQRCLAEDCIERVGIGHVLDIASNDGSQLERFRELGCSVQGVDPSVNLRDISLSKGIDTIVDYWRNGLFPDRHFNIITGTNVFAHVEKIYDFLEAAKFALKDDGILVLEFPYCVEMLKNNYVDQIYHEHLQYYLAAPLKFLFDRVDLKVDDVILTPIHGGSIRFILNKTRKMHCEKFYQIILDEESAGLLCVETYLEFAKTVEQNKNDLLAMVDDIKKEGRKLVAYGASAKLSTILSYCEKVIPDSVFDDNSLKWNYYTPGMNILIKNPQDLAKEPDFVFVLLTAWNFASEIKKKVRKIRGHSNDKFLLYIPGVHLE